MNLHTYPECVCQRVCCSVGLKLRASNSVLFFDLNLIVKSEEFRACLNKTEKPFITFHPTCAESEPQRDKSVIKPEINLL